MYPSLTSNANRRLIFSPQRSQAVFGNPFLPEERAREKKPKVYYIAIYWPRKESRRREKSDFAKGHILDKQ